MTYDFTTLAVAGGWIVVLVIVGIVLLIMDHVHHYGFDDMDDTWH